MDTPLTILIPIHSFEPGGVERVGLNLARSWREAGHEVIVLLGRNEGMDRAMAPDLRYERRPTRLRTARYETLWMIWCLLTYLRRNRVDVIFCAGNTYAVVCAMARLLFGSQCPPIVAKVSNDLVRRDKSRLGRRAYHLWLSVQGLLFDRFVAIAAPAREEILCYMGLSLHRVAVIPDPALSRERLQRLAAIPRSASRAPAVRFLAVGRLVPQKNFALLIDAFARGFGPGDTLTIVGDGPLRSALEAQVQHLSLKRQVRFAGHLLSPDALLERSDCLVLSSDYEGVPAVVIEAIAAGLPVIATDCSTSMAELLGAGSRGVLVPIGSVDALAAWIAGALSLPQLTREARQYAADFVIEEARDRYLAVMREAIAAARDDGSIGLSSTVRQTGLREI